MVTEKSISFSIELFELQMKYITTKQRLAANEWRRFEAIGVDTSITRMLMGDFMASLQKKREKYVSDFIENCNNDLKRFVEQVEISNYGN